MAAVHSPVRFAVCCPQILVRWVRSVAWLPRFRRVSGQLVGVEVEEALGRLESALSELAGLVLYSLSREELLTLLRRFETVRRRMPVVDHVIVSELEARSVAEAVGARNTQAVLRDMVRLSPGEAKRPGAGRPAAGTAGKPDG
jgi:hypothetical protein